MSTDLVSRAKALTKRAADIAAGVKSSASQQAASQAAKQSGRIMFGVDATASRKDCWNQTKVLQADMFFTVQKAGANLAVQLSYYYGSTFAASAWLKDASDLAHVMSQVQCVTGNTQIEKLFDHTLAEHKKNRVGALIFVGDSCEEQEQTLMYKARGLKANNIRLFVFHDEMTLSGRFDFSVSRNVNTGSIFRAVTQAAGGEYAAFDLTSPDVLQDYLKTVAVYSTGNRNELLRLPPKTESGRRFLNNVLRLPPPNNCGPSFS